MVMADRPPVLEVTDPAQWRVCSAPLRLAILDVLRAGAPCTIGHIAKELGRPATALYRHVEELEKAGFVTRAGFRKNGRHVEGLVDLAADNFKIGFKADDGRAETAAVVETARAFCGAAFANVRDAAGAGALRITPADLNVLVAYGLGRLTPEAFAQVRALLGQIRQIMDKGRTERKGDLYAATVVITPVTRAPGRRPRSTAPAKARPRRAAGQSDT